MGVHSILQVAHDVLPGLVGEVGLGHARDRTHGGNGRHDPGQDPKQHEVRRSAGGKQGRVEDFLDEDGVDRAQSGG